MANAKEKYDNENTDTIILQSLHNAELQQRSKNKDDDTRSI